MIHVDEHCMNYGGGGLKFILLVPNHCLRLCCCENTKIVKCLFALDSLFKIRHNALFSSPVYISLFRSQKLVSLIFIFLERQKTE